MLNKNILQYLIHFGLFCLTVLTTTLAGAFWMGIVKEDFWTLLTSADTYHYGFQFSIPFLGILTIHEFGHYFTARRYGVKTSLPYYLPVYFPFQIPQLGTLGAFIRMEGASSRKAIFDIGIAGPLAGFVAALGVMIYGFTNLPPVEYVFRIHPEYAQYGKDYANHVYTLDFAKQQADYTMFLQQQKSDSIYFAEHKDDGSFNFLQSIGMAPSEWEPGEYRPAVMAVGNNLLFMFFEKVVGDSELVPNHFETFHYPWLFAAYMALFFTALNLLPVGQLDGGHVIYGLFGAKKHNKIAPIIFAVFVFVGGIGIFKDNLLGVNFFSADANSIIMFAAIYLYFLYYLFSRAFKGWRNVLMVSAIVFAAQFMVEYLFPAFKGFSGWYVFAFVVGRFLGVHHPSTFDETPLDTKRKILGWICLTIFILCFTPNVLEVVDLME